jgi:hypothetical protein
MYRYEETNRANTFKIIKVRLMSGSQSNNCTISGVDGDYSVEDSAIDLKEERTRVSDNGSMWWLLWRSSRRKWKHILWKGIRLWGDCHKLHWFNDAKKN